MFSAVLMTWAAAGLVDARSPAPATAAPTVDSENSASRTRGLRQAPRDAATLIESPLPGSTRPLRSGGATVQAPDSTPEPVRITILALSIEQDLTELGVIGNTLQVPDDYSDIGWWGGGAVPGRRGAGAAVVVGHVDSPTGPAVFYQLSGLSPGDRIRVRLDDDSRVVFVVEEIEVYNKNKFPSARVYQSRGKPTLHLVTCGGTFDTESRQYNSNVVVYAKLLKRLPPQGEKRTEGRGDKDAGKGEGKGKGQNDRQDRNKDRDRSVPSDVKDGER